MSARAHPAPHRERVSLAALWFGLFGGPAAWTVQSLLDGALAGHGCFPRSTPLAAPVIGGLGVVLLLVGAAALLVCAAAGWAALLCWRRTQDEAPGSHHALAGGGEGRARFMAYCGLLLSGIFALAVAMHAAAVLLVPPCG